MRNETHDIISKVRNYALDLGFLESRPTDSSYSKEQREKDVEVILKAMVEDVVLFLPKIANAKAAFTFHEEKTGRIL